jgi:exonuclease III
MKVLFWNIIGWGQEDRRRQISQFISRERFDIIGLQETMKEEFTNRELGQLGGKHDFIWNWLSTQGHSGGILLGVKQEEMDIGAFDKGNFFVSALLRNKSSGFKWEVIVVYGPAQHEKSEEFLEELRVKY